MSSAEYDETNIDFKDIVSDPSDTGGDGDDNNAPPAEPSIELVADDDLDADGDDTQGDAGDPAEAQAREQGWVPQDEWEGEPSDWVSAREFNKRGELMDRISSQTRKMKAQEKRISQLTDAIKELGKHNAKVAEIEYNKAVEELKSRKLAALEDGEHQAAMQIDDQLSELQQAKAKADAEPDVFDNLDGDSAGDDSDATDQVSQDADKFHPYMKQWVQDNDWYNTDPFLRTQADQLYINYMRMNPGTDEPDAIDYVGEEIRKNFPQKFGNPRRSNPDTLAGGNNSRGGSRRTSKKSGFTSRDLSPEQRDIAKTFVQAGAFKNVQAYVDQLAEIGEIPAQKGE